MARTGADNCITRAHVVFVNPSVSAIGAGRSRYLGRSMIDFDGRGVVYPSDKSSTPGKLDEVVRAFSTTIHKSQGAEYPADVIPVVSHYTTMLQCNLIYTGMTCGKRLVVSVGQLKVGGIAVRGERGRRRWSKLNEMLIMDAPTIANRPTCGSEEDGPSYRRILVTA